MGEQFYRVSAWYVNGYEPWLYDGESYPELERKHRQYLQMEARGPRGKQTPRKYNRKLLNRARKCRTRYYYIPESSLNGRPGEALDWQPPPREPFFGTDRSLYVRRLAGYYNG